MLIPQRISDDDDIDNNNNINERKDESMV